jgi:hypothetical protein
MFKTVIAEPAVKVPLVQLIPLVELQLSLDTPGDGWAAHLADRNIAIVLDDLGRPSIARADARQLFAERAQHEARRREFIARADEAAIEFDRARRAELFAGIPADLMPPGVAPAAVMLQTAKDAQPKRRTLLQEALTNSQTLTFHSLAEQQEDE